LDGDGICTGFQPRAWKVDLDFGMRIRRIEGCHHVAHVVVEPRMEIKHAQTAVDSHAQSGNTGTLDEERYFQAISWVRHAPYGEIDRARCRRGIWRFAWPSNRSESIPGRARLVLAGDKVNGTMRLSAGKFAGGAVEGTNRPHCLVGAVSERYQRRHQRKRKRNGFHPHNLSTQRPAAASAKQNSSNPCSKRT
jgi:hypothetical protein